MRRRFSTSLVLAFAVGLSAQSPIEPDTPAGVSVLKFNWHKLTYREGWDAPQDPATSHELDPRNDSSRDSGPGQVPTAVGTVPYTRASDRTWERKRPRATTENQSTVGDQSTRSGKLEEYTYQVRIKNLSGKTIEAVDWEYLFLDSGTRSEFARHRFQSFRRAETGKSLTLVGTSFAPPTRVLNARHDNKNKSLEESLVIRCVLYSDGTAGWRTTGTEGDCESIRKSARSRQK